MRSLCSASGSPGSPELSVARVARSVRPRSCRAEAYRGLRALVDNIEVPSINQLALFGGGMAGCLPIRP